MLRVFVFVALITWTSAADGGFEHFCKEEVNGKLEKNIDNKTICTATFNLDDVNQAAAEAICQHRGRFAYKIPDVGKDVVNCTYELTGNCPSGQYINGQCYKAMGQCDKTEGWYPAPWSDRQAFRWIARIFGHYRVAKFELSKNHTEPTHTYRKNTLELATKKKPTELAVLLHRMPVFGGNPHEIVYLADGSKEQPPVVTICQSEPFGETGAYQAKTDAISSGVVASHASAANGGRVIKAKDNSYNLVLSRNVYSLKLAEGGEINLTYFHGICKNICRHCFAATPSYLEPGNFETPLDLPGRYWLPGGRRAVGAENGCKPQRDSSAVSQWAILYHDNHRKKNGILDEKYWKSGLPNRNCSDQGRYAMAYETGKGVIDVPIFDRLPLICVRGKPLAVPDTCLKNSESDGKGGCKCLPGTKDVADDNIWTKQNQTTEDVKKYAISLDRPPGYLCVKDTCTSLILRKLPYQAILFLIDGSGSVVQYCPTCWMSPNSGNKLSLRQTSTNFNKLALRVG